MSHTDPNIQDAHHDEDPADILLQQHVALYGDSMMETSSTLGDDGDDDGGNTPPDKTGYPMIIPRGSIQNKDILKGYDTEAKSHPGNVHFRIMVGALFDEHRASKKIEKTTLTENLVKTILNEGGRFLKLCVDDDKKPLINDQGETLWEEMNGEEAREKVASTFRNITKKLKRSRRR